MFRLERFIIFFGWFLLLCHAGINLGYSQNDFSDIEESHLYSSELEIVNGTKWYYQNKFKGHPFWNEDHLFKGSVVFNGESFSDLALKYELVENELILTKKVDGRSRALKLNEKFVDSFTLEESGVNKSHLFKKLKLPGVDGVKYYHVVYKGETSCYIYHSKTINNRVSGNYLGRYLYHPEIYVTAGEKYVKCKNKKAFLRIFEDHKKLLRTYMRKNNVSFDSERPDDIAKVLKFYDNLSH